MFTRFKFWSRKKRRIESPLLFLISLAMAICLWTWIKISIGVE